MKSDRLRINNLSNSLCFLGFLLFKDEADTIDLLVNDSLLVELKAVQDVVPIHKAR